MIGGDFAKYCGLLRIYELLKTFMTNSLKICYVTCKSEQSETFSTRCITHENPVVVKLSTVDR